MIEANGWDNHEDTFEETIRRELLAAQQTIHILKEDNKELTKAYYLLLKENERLKKIWTTLAYLRLASDISLYKEMKNTRNQWEQWWMRLGLTKFLSKMYKSR